MGSSLMGSSAADNSTSQCALKPDGTSHHRPIVIGDDKALVGCSI